MRKFADTHFVISSFGVLKIKDYMNRKAGQECEYGHSTVGL